MIPVPSPLPSFREACPAKAGSGSPLQQALRASDNKRSTGLRMNPEVITMGRVSVDLYPEQIGATLAEVETFAKSLGGSATNVAVAAARLGHPSAVITKVGDDGFGPYVRSTLEGFGVNTTWVGTDPEFRTPLAF